MAIQNSRSKVRLTQESIEYKLWNDQSAANTTSDEIDCLGVEAVSLSVRSNESVSGGVVTLETSPVSGDTGTWKALGTLTTNAANTWFQLSVAVGSNPGLPLGHIRARISTVLTGGHCDAYLAVRK